jgi:hypothetical protein
MPVEINPGSPSPARTIVKIGSADVKFRRSKEATSPDDPHERRGVGVVWMEHQDGWAYPVHFRTFGASTSLVAAADRR